MNQKIGAVEEHSADQIKDKEIWKERVAYWKSYPDVFYAQIKDKDAPYGTLFFNDFFLRLTANYKNVMIAGSRGITKTYTDLREKFHRCIFYSDVVETIVGPTKEQAVKVVKDALNALLRNYPALRHEFDTIADTRDVLVLQFKNRSILRTESTANTARGGNDTDIGVEEIAQKEFNHELFTTSFLPRLRLMRRLRGEVDKTAIFLKETYITSCAPKTNPAYDIYTDIDSDMLKLKSAFVAGCSIEVPIRYGLQEREKVEKRQKKMTAAEFDQEYRGIWTGSSRGFVIKADTVKKSRVLKYAEMEHCGSEYCKYLVAVDIAREDGQENAYCAIVVLKLTPITDKDRDNEYNRFWKDVVYIKRFKDIDHRELAHIIKHYVEKYNAYELVIDANGLGVSTRDELMYDLGDGYPPYGVINDKDGRLEARTASNALRIMYMLKSSTTDDADSKMVSNAEVEFEQGRVRLLCDKYEGLREYKKKHRIKDDYRDMSIMRPYIETDQLEKEISNLKQLTSGHTVKEKRISIMIPRDIWSALKYGLWRVKALENSLSERDFFDSVWDKRFINEEEPDTHPSAGDSLFFERYRAGDRFINNSRRPFGARRELFK